MWAAWTLFALFQVATHRYLKSVMRGIGSIYMHIISGLLQLSITLFFAFMAFDYLNWNIKSQNHVYIVVPCTIGLIAIVILGFASRSAMRRCKWNTRCALRVKAAHRAVAYLFILGGFAAMYTGIY